MAYNKLKPMRLGPLPVELIAKIGLKVEPGEVIFSISAQKHAISRHPEEYALCLPHLTNAIISPTHIGQAPDHKNVGIELIYEHVEEKVIILVAVHLEANEDGSYIVKSTYPIDRNKLERRVRKKFIISTK